MIKMGNMSLKMLKEDIALKFYAHCTFFAQGYNKLENYVMSILKRNQQMTNIIFYIGSSDTDHIAITIMHSVVGI